MVCNLCYYCYLWKCDLGLHYFNLYGKHTILIFHFDFVFCFFFLIPLIFSLTFPLTFPLQAGEKFCSMDEINGEIWPKCPDGNTVINRTCPVGRVGFKSRTCAGSTWQPVSSKCISQELSKVFNSAEVSLHYLMVLWDWDSVFTFSYMTFFSPTVRLNLNNFLFYFKKEKGHKSNINDYYFLLLYVINVNIDFCA